MKSILLYLGAGVLAGCMVSAAPVIDDLRMSPTSSLEADGVYHVRGSISFHSESSLVRKIRITIPKVAQTYELGSNLGVRGDTMDFDVQLHSQTPKGELAYDVSLVDAQGVPSEARRLSVTLQ
jgi:hypothetical protein